nr:ATP-binding protein [Maridesulfovibrio ferrireducens]
MQPAIKSKKDDDHNIIQTGINREPEALPCVAILGANASGKSNVLKAFSFLKKIIQESVLRKKEDLFEDNCFRLNPTYANKPTCFRIKFIALNGHMYQYWLELVPEEIIREKLTAIPNTKGAREVTLIDREQNKLELHRSIHPKKAFLNVWKAEINNQQTALALLSNKGEISIFDSAISWFKSFGQFTSTNIPEYVTASFIQNETINIEHVTHLLKSADINVHEVNINEKQRSLGLSPSEEYIFNDSDGLFNPKLEISFSHLDIQGNPIPFNFQDDESNGTKTFFSISGMIILNLYLGTPVAFDELDSALHPYLVRKIIQLFTNKATNPKGAQLIFSTHDVTVMDKTLLRPDEIYFTEKDKDTFETRLFSLSEFKGVGSVSKNDRGQKLYKDYLDGRFGAVPEVDWDGGL